MSERAPFAYPRDGSVIVCGDGPELLVYSGANDGPMWKQFGEGLIVGVGATRERIYSLDADGRLCVWRTVDGARQERFQVDEVRPRDLVVAADGTCAVLGDEAVVVVDPAFQLRTLPQPGATAATFGSDSGVLAVGDEQGGLHLLDTGNAAVLQAVALGSPIAGLCFRPQGEWVASMGRQLHLVGAAAAAPDAPPGLQVVRTVELGGDGGPVACSEDGALLAVVVDRQRVLVIETDKYEVMGSILYERDVHGLQFGPGGWLAIGLDYGDANRVDLSTGQLTRTGTHAGRTTNRWGFKVEVDHIKLRGAVAAVRAGGMPLARHIKLQKADETVGGLSCLQVIGILFLLMLLCTGCSGLITALWYMFA